MESPIGESGFDDAFEVKAAVTCDVSAIDAAVSDLEKAGRLLGYVPIMVEVSVILKPRRSCALRLICRKK